MTALRNFLICCGAHYLWTWLRLVLFWPWGQITNGAGFSGDLQIMLLMPVVDSVPDTLAGLAAGYGVGRLVDGRFPSRWALLVATLIFVQCTLGARRFWVTGPGTEDYVGIVVGGVIPAVACIIGAVIAEGRKNLRSQKVD